MDALKKFAAGMVFFLIMGVLGGAHAYSVYDTDSTNTPSIGGGGLDSLIAPFESFIKSITSIGSVKGPFLTPINVPSMPTGNSMITTGIEAAFQSFDNWLYGVVGFHIGGIFLAVLGVFSWVLGTVKSAVDWLLRLLRS